MYKNNSQHAPKKGLTSGQPVCTLNFSYKLSKHPEKRTFTKHSLKPHFQIVKTHTVLLHFSAHKY